MPFQKEEVDVGPRVVLFVHTGAPKKCSQESSVEGVTTTLELFYTAKHTSYRHEGHPRSMPRSEWSALHIGRQQQLVVA
jgi:hypothetical protein